MRHKNFIVGMVVGAMLAGATFIVSTVDARPRRPGARPPPRGSEKTIPGPKKKERKPTVPVVYECPSQLIVAGAPVTSVPPGWTLETKESYYFNFSNSHADKKTEDSSTITCFYSSLNNFFPGQVKRLYKDVQGTNCKASPDASNRKVTCYK